MWSYRKVLVDPLKQNGNPFIAIGSVHFHFKGCWVVFFIFIILKANSGDPDQTPHYVVSDLGLHCLPMSHKKDARLIWIKSN